MSLKAILFTYIIGGLTLPPLLVIGLLYLLSKVLPVYVEEDEKDDDFSDIEEKEYHNLKLTEIEEAETSGVKAYKAGWITVTREYHTFVNNANDKQVEHAASENKSAYTALYKLVKTNKKDQSTESEPSSPSTNPGMTQKVRRKNRFYGVLRHGNLFLYKDELQKDVQHVIVLSNRIATVWPRGLKDGELFTKRTAICLLKKTPRRKSDTPPKSSSASLSNEDEAESIFDVLEKGVVTPKHLAFFLYADTNYEKENWYFELIKATKRQNFEPTGSELDKLESSTYANPLHFQTADMISLIQTLHSSEGQLQTRWLNALIGRIFLSVQHTDYFENVVRAKLLKKLAKINKPGFLDEFKVKKIDVGTSAPFISFPKLQEINPDGSLRVSFHFTYKGKLSMQVATKANINLGSRFKTREITILLAVTVNKIEGPLVISIKPPPSGRLWYTFEKMPDVDLTVEPVVSQRQIKYSMITKVIENKLRDSIKDSLVEPAWDDIAFFDTSNELYRGGIWDTSKRPEPELPPEIDTADEGEPQDFAEFEVEEHDIVDDLDTLNSNGAYTNDFNPSDEGSIRSRETNTVKSKSSFTGNVATLNKKKSTPSTGMSNEQFLADGSYVSKESETTRSSFKIDEKPTRSSTMQIISEEALAGRKTISSSFKKIGKWYNEKNRGSPTAPSSKEAVYKAPEMIQSRRRAPSSSSDTGSKQISRAPSNGDLESIISSDPSSPHPRAAPQPHDFPAEFLYGLETQRPDEELETKNFPPTKIAAMKSPYTRPENFSPLEESPQSSPVSPTLPKRVNFPKRKPVDPREGEGKFDATVNKSPVSDGNDEHPSSDLDEVTAENIAGSDPIIEQESSSEVVEPSPDKPGNPPALPIRRLSAHSIHTVSSISGGPPLFHQGISHQLSVVTQLKYLLQNMIMSQYRVLVNSPTIRNQNRWTNLNKCHMSNSMFSNINYIG